MFRSNSQDRACGVYLINRKTTKSKESIIHIFDQKEMSGIALHMKYKEISGLTRNKYVLFRWYYLVRLYSYSIFPFPFIR